MRILRLVFCALCLAVAACAGRPVAVTEGCEIALRYVEAGNSGNAAEIEPWLDDRVAARFLEEEASAGAGGSTIHGKQAVLEAVANYTAQCPGCRSELSCLAQTAGAVYAVEEVAFTDQDGVARRQSAPLVIELDGKRIINIVYFPATASTP